MDERTECMGAGYVVGGDVIPLMTLSLLVGGPLASVRAEAVYFTCCGMCLLNMDGVHGC